MKKFFLFFLLSPLVSFAQDKWEYVVTTNPDDIYYIKDVTSYENQEKFSVWVKIQKSDKKKYFKDQKYYKPSDLVLTKWNIDCYNKTTKTLTMIVYDVKGKVKNSTNGPFEESYVIPDSVAEKVLNTVCSKFN